jgi:protein-tyrosine-phosphatase
MNRDLLRALTAEAIGTFALVFAGAGAVMVDAKTHALGHVGVAITFGLVIMAMIYTIGHVSGAHFNGAVTFAFALTRHFPWTRAFAYWGAQLVGALVAATILRGSLGNIAHVGATLPSGSQGQSFLWELVMTSFLMFVILAVATDTRAGRGGGRGRDRRHDRPGCDVRRPDLRRLDEPDALARAGARLRGPARALALHRCPAHRRGARRARLPARARRAPAPGRARRPDRRIEGGSRVSKVLFVCVGNQGRSVIAERLFWRTAAGRHQARSAGSNPGAVVHPQVLEALAEIGIDVHDHAPHKLNEEDVAWADVVVATCDDACPVVPGKRYISWELPDPKNEPLERVQAIRDDIARRVDQLVDELDQEDVAA